MKITSFLSVSLLAVCFIPAQADITIEDAAYSVSTFFTGSNPDNSIVSYDWSGSNLYYMETDPNFNFGGFYQAGDSTPIAAGDTSLFSGASVVAIGNYVYYNDSDETGAENIFAYNTTNGSTANVSTVKNYGLYKHNGALFITGAQNTGSPNHIYQTDLNSDGTFTLNPPKDLGVDAGSSGPLTFDSAGNLYYAPGFGDLSIYKWSAAEVAAALADPAGHPLTATGHLWADYSGLYTSQSGATSLIVSGSQLLVTLTSFSDPSELVSFGIGDTGAYDNTTDAILSSTSLLGELRENDGNLFVSDGDSIEELSAPEPSTWALLGLGLLAVFAIRKKRVAVTVALATLIIATSGVSAVAGPFSPAADQPGSNGVSDTDPNIIGWATSVVSITRGPVDITQPNGAVATSGSPSDALGPATATADNPFPVVSLGDGGSITLSFAQPIGNGPGADFAVFENGFPETGVPNAYFLELATVAVSSDGVHFFTFPSVSLTPTTAQVGGFGTLDPTNLYNLAGSEIAGYGTPFNLDDLVGISPFLNVNDILEVKITDVIGNINPALGPVTEDDASNPIFDGKYGTTDHVINDPFKTNFTTGGFDLDGVAVLNPATPEPSTWTLMLFGTVLIGTMFRGRRDRANA